MSHWPALGFFDEGADLASPDFYASAIRADRPASVLPPAAFRSLSFSMLEDEAIWSQEWVCVGALDDIPGEGDLLPFTIGNHGVHVQRTANGLQARFNKAQHGGCRAIPLQCQTGAKTKCSFTSCGYSRDRRAISASELGDATPQMHQYLGLRPERLLQPAVRAHGPLIFVNLNPAAAWPGDNLAGAPLLHALPAGRSNEIWSESQANWKIMASALLAGDSLAASDHWLATGAAGESAVGAVWLFPNLVLLAEGAHTAVIVLQPTAIGQTLRRISVRGPDADAMLERVLARVAACTAAAEASHRDAVQFNTQHRPDTIGRPPPPQTSPAGLWMQRALAGRVARFPAARSLHARVANF